jgi:hypothetical protein
MATEFFDWENIKEGLFDQEDWDVILVIGNEAFRLVEDGD